MLYTKRNLKGIRTRLRQGKLTEEDLALLNDLLDGAEEVADLKVDKKGRVLVAQLPFGMDVVK